MILFPVVVHYPETGNQQETVVCLLTLTILWVFLGVFFDCPVGTQNLAVVSWDLRWKVQGIRW